MKKNKERGKTVTNKKNLSVLLEAVEILKNECLLEKGETMKILKYENKTIKPRPNGRGYYVRYRDANGQHAIYGESAEDVLLKLKQALKNAPKKERQPRNVLTLGIWWNKWLKVYKQGIRMSTGLTYKSVFNCHISKFAGKPLSWFNTREISVIEEINEFLNSIAGSRQRVKVFNYLKACLEQAKTLGLIEVNILDLLPRPKHKKINIRPLTVQEQQLFVESIKGCTYEDLYLVMLLTGLRVGEALALTRGDLNFNNKTIHVHKTYSTGVLSDPKTETSNRVVPMFGICSDILSKFASYDNSFRIFKHDIKNVSKTLKEICEGQGINNVSTHTLRKTFATRLFEFGVPALQIQQWLGHSDVLTTERIYIKLAPNSNQKWLNLANNVLNFDTQFDTQLSVNY